MSTWRFLACNALSGARLGYIDLQEVQFNDPVTGVGGLTGKAYWSPQQDRDVLDLVTANDQVALFVTLDGEHRWCGLIKSRPWSPENRCRTISAVQWKGWLGVRFIGPNSAVNPVTDVTYGYTATDQLTIAQAIITFATTGTGTPTIQTNGETSGVARDLNWLGSDFRYAADLIDSMATRDNGFDWTIGATTDAVTSLPSLVFQPFYPQRGGQSPSLVFKKTPNGGNFSPDGDIEDTTADRRTRIWTTGAGSPPDRLMASDQDPAMADDTVLLSESVSGYDSVITVATLAANAQTERAFRNVPTNTMTIRAFFADLDPGLYGTGDRAQLIYSDEGLDIDLPAVRMIDVQHNVNIAGADYARITLDLSDSVLPDDSQVQ